MNLSPPQPDAAGGLDLSAVEVLAQALDAVSAYISFVDADLRYRWVNRRYEDWFRRPRHEIVGRALKDLMTPEQFALVEPEARRALAGERVQYEVEAPAPDGRVSVFEVSYIPAGRGQGFTVLSMDRTEERRAERALRESEARYGTLVQHLPGAVYRSRPGDYWTVEYVSAGVEELTGYPAADFTGAGAPRSFAGLILPEDRERVDREVAAALESGRPYAVEYRIRHRDGSLRWVLDKGQTHGGPAPAETRVEGVGFDITERKRAEEALRRVAEGVSAATGAEFFRSLVTHLAASLEADHVMVATLAGAANERVRTLAAFARGRMVENFEYELAGTPCEQVVTRSLCCYAAEVQRHFPADAMLGDMGAEAYVGTPLTDSQGRTLGLVAALWTQPLHSPDPAEALLRIFAARAATELERMRSEEGLRLAARVFDAAAEGIMISDAEDRIVSVNRAFADITGYAPEELAGQHRSLLRSGLHADAFHDDIARQVEQSGQWQGEIWNRRKDGSAFPAWMSISAVRNPGGRIVSRVTILSDISPLKESQQRLEQLANFDPLTGLPNRNLLEDRVRHGIEKARRSRQRLALLFLDLDDFKAVNDGLGHDAGDRLLALVAVRLRQSVRDQDTVARFGGDEFVIVLDDLAEPQQAARMADRIAENFREPFELEGRHQGMSFSMGIALFPDDGADLPSLLRNADLALYRAKEYGRNGYRFFTEDLNVQAFERRLLETSLQRALERDEFVLHYQPVVEMAGGCVTGFEALLHWRHPEVGLLPPSRFIGVAEAGGLIVPIGARVLRAACRQAAAWGAAGPPKPVVTVNVSPRQLADPEIVQQVRDAIAASGLRPELLELDVTEEAIMRDPGKAEDTLRELRKIGVRIAVDDFGTGRSSLALLRRLPVDALKIDRALVRDVASSPDAASIVRAILGLARSYNLRAAAEGVETTAQRDFLLGGGCALAQGYLYAAALSAGNASRVLAKGTLGPE